MEKEFWMYYFIIINIAGFLLFLLNTWFRKHTEKGKIDGILNVVSVMGGTAGVLLSMLAFDRKVQKESVMSKVFNICVLVIQIVILLAVKGHLGENITFAFWKFFEKYKILTIYLGIVNLVTFVVFAIDKWKAVRQKSRIKIVTLLGLAFVGGSLGGLIAMYLFRHKTTKDYFTVGIPLIMVMQIVVIFYVMNRGL